VAGENRSAKRKPCGFSTTLSTTNPTWTTLELNSAYRDENAASNRLSHDKTFLITCTEVKGNGIITFHKNGKYLFAQNTCKFTENGDNRDY
jgi:hypothetical protein